MHLRVVPLGVRVGDDALGRLGQLLAGALGEQAARRAADDDDDAPVVALEVAGGERIEPRRRACCMRSTMSLRRILVEEVDVQRVLLLADLGAQRVAQRLEIVERRVQPLARQEELPLGVHVVDGALERVGGQRAQLARRARRPGAGWPRGRGSRRRSAGSRCRRCAWPDTAAPRPPDPSTAAARRRWCAAPGAWRARRSAIVTRRPRDRGRAGVAATPDRAMRRWRSASIGRAQ